MKVSFYGVRGSVPSPLTGKQVEEKIVKAIMSMKIDDGANIKELVQKLPFNLRSTYGGNTTCVEVRTDNNLPIIFDMGTGIRELGKSMIPEIIGNSGINGIILQSHVHWDHLQGLPFWAPMFMSREKFNNYFMFYGGKSWESELEHVLQGQMSPPVFPINIEELRATAMKMEFFTIFDTWTKKIETELTIRARKLFHPQETFGYSISTQNVKLVFTTDHEPYASGIPNGLADLVDGSDVWITDCQYTHDAYLGKKDGVQKLGWGHSYPEYIANVAKECGAKKVVTTHHDPASTDIEIEMIAQKVQDLSGVQTIAAYEGLVLEL